MYYLVDVDHKSDMAVQLTRSDLKGFKKCCISSGMGGTAVNMLWKGSAHESSDCVDGDSDTDTDRYR